ncbi:MAG: carbohydrate-binding domain-containing protein, partial [Paludibacteraceae bacterium]|nr:carbohydrate-binding domain-containing protein [Paludibacteraceae bacterium]
MKKWLFVIGLAAGLVACNPDEPDPGTDPTVDPEDTTAVAVDDEDDLVENSTWNQTVSIVWNGASASVTGASDSVVVTEKNGVVTVNAEAKHVEYVLSGTGTGQLNMYSDYKLKLTLSDLSLTCSDGPAINNQSHKRTFVVLEGTNTLADGASYATSTEDRKAALFSE